MSHLKTEKCITTNINHYRTENDDTPTNADADASAGLVELTAVIATATAT